jgi:hypothetical protein
MKRLLVAMIIAAAAAAAGFSQAANVTLQNQEDADFYYVIDPSDLADVTAGSPLLSSKVGTFFAARATAPEFSVITGGGAADLSGLADGTHLLVGFFAVNALESFPVRVISLQADSRVGTRFYALFASPSQLTVPRGTGRLAAFARPATTQAATTTASATTASATTATATTAVTTTTAAATTATATTAAAPVSLHAISVFSARYDPVIFSRETKGSFDVLPVGQSRGWALTGTRISRLDGARDAGGLHLALTVPGGFSEKVSYFLYVFTNRSSGASSDLTLEIEPRANGSRAACLLWKNGADRPVLLGTATTIGDTVRIDISGDSAQAAPLFDDNASADLTAGWYDKALGSWEEFYYTTVALADVPAE